jgi:hypothetical protein
MKPEQINSILLDRENFLYCSFELTVVSKEPQIVVFIELERCSDGKKKGVWPFVAKEDLQRLKETHDHSLVKTTDAESIISLKIFDDSRLRRQELQF